MKAKGLRILDKKDKTICVKLPDILKEIQNGNSLNWSILYLYATGHLGKGKSIPLFEEQIIESKKGLFISWDELNSLSYKLNDVMDIVLIGCNDKDLLRRYDNDQEMYNTCDIVIEMVDSNCWEIFSKDNQLIERLAGKFKETEFLEPDFEK